MDELDKCRKNGSINQQDPHNGVHWFAGVPDNLLDGVGAVYY